MKKFRADVKFYDPDDEDSAEFDTWEAAGEWLKEQRRYGLCRMAINNQRVKIHGEHVVNDEPERSASDNSTGSVLLEALRPPTREELERILRPVPTNPATPGFDDPSDRRRA